MIFIASETIHIFHFTIVMCSLNGFSGITSKYILINNVEHLVSILQKKGS